MKKKLTWIKDLHNNLSIFANKGLIRIISNGVVNIFENL
jgi:hypothetical protein